MAVLGQNTKKIKHEGTNLGRY